MKTFEEFLQEIFNNEREYGGMPITKDNCDDLFENWLSDLDVNALIDYADMWGQN